MFDILNPQHCVSNNLHKTARIISRIYGEEMRSCGLQRSQFAILGNLNSTQTVALNQLAGLLYMERTTLSRNLKPLVQQGYITIRPSDTDGRSKEVAITAAGRAKFAQALTLWRRAQQRVIQAYGETQWRDLEAALKDLRSIQA
jgi:DNA-binding MarR family transcriptional regulator